MKPDWDKLMDQFKDHANILVADVDCTAGGKSLCTDLGVRGYPTIRYGEPGDLQDYKGGRDFKSLEEFAKGLKPQCSPANIDLCDDEKKAEIERLQKMSKEDREEEIADKTRQLEKLEAEFKTLLEGLQKQYEEADKKKTADIQAIKDSGLGLLKSVHANEAKKKSSEEL